MLPMKINIQSKGQEIEGLRELGKERETQTDRQTDRQIEVLAAQPKCTKGRQTQLTEVFQ